MKRHQLSGAQKRKVTKENKQKTETLIKKLPKLTSFMKASPGTSSVPNEENISQSQNVTKEETVHMSTDSEKGASEISETDSTVADQSFTDDYSASVKFRDKSDESVQAVNNNRKPDPGGWGEFSSDDTTYWIEKGPVDCQHHDSSFEKSRRTFNNEKQTRYCSNKIFSTKIPNGEVSSREWLLYSPSKGSVFCFVCKLFGSSTSTVFAEQGFSDWRNPVMVEHHEKSSGHRDCMLKYLIRRQGRGLTQKLEEQIKTERDYWHHVLQRAIAVIRTLSERGLAFRGKNEKFGSPDNGNYMGLLELIAEFDPFLASHITKYGNAGSGITSYLSKTTCDEIISLMSSRVLSAIVNEANTAGYFSLSVDSTPDLSHTDQLSIILRYVSPLDGKPVERFLSFLVLENHTGEQLANQVLHFFKNVCKIDFSKCRGQSYDNAANMTGRYKGMQQKILEENKYAAFIPCAAHSLNLVGRSAVDSCLNAVNFFSTVQLVYTFFSSSTHRWSVLKSHLKGNTVPKSLSSTRWEAHYFATSAILKSYSCILEALENIMDDSSQKGETIRDAGAISDKMQELEFTLMLVLWNEILGHFHAVSKTLQNPSLNLNVCADLYTTLSSQLREIRDQFDKFETMAKELLPEVNYKDISARKRKRKIQKNDGNAPEAELNAREKFKIFTFNVIIDALEMQMSSRGMVYKQVAERFSFLNDMNLSDSQYQTSSEKLAETYPEDLCPTMTTEVKQFHTYLRAKSEKPDYTHAQLYEIIVNDGIQAVFPNTAIALRIFLSMMVTNCSAERSFSLLKRIKNPYRTTMTQERLDSLALLSIESDFVRQLSFEDIIKDFAFNKSRRRTV